MQTPTWPLPPDPPQPAQAPAAPTWPAATPYAPYPPPPRKHSGFGIASFALSMFNGLFLFVLVVVAGIAEAATPGGLDEESPALMIVGAVFLFGLLLALVGLALGIAGAFQRDRKRVFTVLGLVFNVVTLLFGLFLFVLGGLAT